MNIEEYITALTEQIRWKKARQGVAQEIRNHIADQTQAYEQSGIEHDKAVEMAVREMGDPIEAGAALDRIHRPQLDWRLFLMTVLFSVIGVFLMYVTGALGAGTGQLMRQVVFTFFGIAVTVIIYFMDYTFIGKYALPIYILMSIVFIIYLKTGTQVNGCIPALRSLVYLYVPVYAGILYRYRGNRVSGIIRSGLFVILTAILTLELAGSSFIALSIAVICTLLLFYAVYKGWFQVNKKRAFILIAVTSALLLISAAAYILCFSHDYQRQRLLAFFNQSSRVNEENFQLLLVRRTLYNAKIIGGDAENLLKKQLVQNDTFLIFAQAIAMYGAIAGAAIIAAFALVACRALNIVKRQKSQLGMMISAACFLVVAFNCTTGILMNFGLWPMSALQFPFLSVGGSSTLVYAVIIGLLLSCNSSALLHCHAKLPT